MVVTIEEMNQLLSKVPEKQQKIIDFLEENKGNAYTYEDISLALRLTVSTVHAYVNKVTGRHGRNTLIRKERISRKVHLYYAETGENENGVQCEQKETD